LKILSLVILFSAAVLNPAVALSPFGKEMIAMTDGELAEIRSAIGKALETYKSGYVAKWESKESGRAGQAVVLDTYQMRGMKCARLTHLFTKGGGKTYTAPLCQVEDGSWKLAF
jgi:surface antigen